jgi:hypothetical protein
VKRVVSFVALILSVQAIGSAAIQGPPSPSASERVNIIEAVRKVALQYTANLPDFICTLTVRRQEAAKNSRSWRPVDTLVLEIAVSETGESRKLLSINGKPTQKSTNDLDGFYLGGEYAGTLEGIFGLKSETKFQWERWEDLSGQLAHVFSYSIDKAHSKYTLSFDQGDNKKGRDVFAWRGLVYVDRETLQVMRLTHAAEGFPADWPVMGLSGELDYGFVDVAGKRVLLPLHAENRVLRSNESQSRSVMEFSNYHQFRTETTIRFEK